MTWDEVGYIVSSEYRKDTMAELASGAKTPSDIADATDIKIPHISRSLKQLRDRNLVTLMNPEAKKGRLYTLSDSGEEVWAEMEDQSLTA